MKKHVSLFMFLISILIIVVLLLVLLRMRRNYLQLAGQRPVISAESQPSPSGSITRHLTVNGLDRSYLLYIPQGLDVKKPVPVILAFHGGGGTAETFALNTNLNARAGADGFVIVYPQGFGRSWNAGDCCGPAQRRGIDDIAFVKALLADLASVITLDPRRLFATGFSNGGKFSYRLACELSDKIAAIAVGSAGISIPPGGCHPARPVSVLHFHGLADKYAPFQGGMSAREPAGQQRSVADTFNLWVRLNGCTGEKRVTYQRGAATCTTYAHCQDSAEITLCTIEGMGHQWAGGMPIRTDEFGPNTADISATEMLLEFFHKHPMPQPAGIPEIRPQPTQRPTPRPSLPPPPPAQQPHPLSQHRSQGFLGKALSLLAAVFQRGKDGGTNS